MKLLFVHNIKLHKDNKGNVYTHSSYNREVWKRYQSISDKLSIITRKTKKILSESEAKQKLESFDDETIQYFEINDVFSSIFTFLFPKVRIKNNHIIKKAVLENDYLIARLPSYAGYKSISYAKKSGKPYLIEIVACPWDGLMNHSLKGKLLAPFAYFKLRRFAKGAPYTVYVTNKFLQKRYPTDGLHVNCSNVLLNEIEEKVLEQRLDKIINLKKDQKIILGTTAAVDVKYKGQQYVIEAIGKLKKQGLTNYEYHLVGGGEIGYLTSIAKKHDVLEQVKFIGSLPHKKVFDWLDSIDIYVQPSRQEGLPRALVEAMSRALPAFGADTAGIPELLESQFIFSNTKNNIEEICSILKNYNKDLMRIQAVRNFNESRKYDKQLIEKRRNEFFREFIENNN